MNDEFSRWISNLKRKYEKDISKKYREQRLMTKTNRLFNDLGVVPPYYQKIEGDHISSVIIAPKNSINYPKTPINDQKVLKTTDIQCNIDILENGKQFIPKIQ